MSKYLITGGNLGNEEKKEEKQEIQVPDEYYKLFPTDKRMTAQLLLLMPPEWRDKSKVAIIDPDTVNRRYAKFFGGNTAEGGLTFYLYSIDGIVYADYIHSVIREGDKIYVLIDACQLVDVPKRMYVRGVSYEGQEIEWYDITTNKLYVKGEETPELTNDDKLKEVNIQHMAENSVEFFKKKKL